MPHNCLAMAVVLLVAGCGTGGPAASDIPITDELRAACSALSDGDIRTVLESAAANRDRGMSKQQNLDSAEDACANTAEGNSDAADECTACLSAAVELVYPD
ncbi:MAG TPA: hypothetical protein VMZ31_03215 [Phycisphaerae bacterium]|nr:hypothetical protein [Phycisphaerae bacterium]